MKKFRSYAQWPKSPHCRAEITTDHHYTLEDAQGVCNLLEKEGINGVLPLKTWAENRCNEEYNGFCQTSEDCKDKLVIDDGTIRCKLTLEKLYDIEDQGKTTNLISDAIKAAGKTS